MTCKKYHLYQQEARKTISLIPYSEWITSCIQQVCPQAVVKVHKYHYEVYANISNHQLRMAGRLICRKPELGRWAVKKGTGKQVFTKFEEISFDRNDS